MNSQLSDKIVWLGHASFRIDTDQVIYIDPYELPDAPVPSADIILITHSHYDHLSPNDIRKIMKQDTVIVTEKSCVKKVSGDVREVAVGDTLTVNGVTIEAVASYNINKKFHPKKNNWIGFVIEIDGERIYHTGDSDLIPEMNAIQADIALLPVSGTYVMTAEEAARAAEILKPKLAIPMHYGAVAGDAADAVTFQKALEGKIPVVILEKANG